MILSGLGRLDFWDLKDGAFLEQLQLDAPYRLRLCLEFGEVGSDINCQVLEAPTDRFAFSVLELSHKGLQDKQRKTGQVILHFLGLLYPERGVCSAQNGQRCQGHVS